MASATTISLTPSDSLTLSKLFNPETPAPSPLPTSTTLPADPHYATTVLTTLKSVERRAIQLAETGSLDAAFTELTQLLDQYPLYASGYNNRAQLRRMLKHPREEVLGDLTAAIENARADGDCEEVSVHQGRVLANAYAQRGIVRAEAGRDRGEKEGETEGVREDMGEAARYGNDVAREWCVKMNPYARLCGQIVSEAMGREMKGGATIM